MEGSAKAKINYTLLAAILTALVGCEQTFEPIKENNLYNYTMYAVLDLSADTQWVRVMPVRNTILKDSVPNNATVKLTRLSTSETVVLEDSLFKLSQDSYVWNFWTDSPLFGNEKYLLEAISPEGNITSATAMVPPEFPQPDIYYRENTSDCYIQINELAENIPVVEIEYTFRIQRDVLSGLYSFPISHTGDLEPGIRGKQVVVSNDVQRIASEFGADINQLRDLSGTLTVVSADTNWYEMDRLDTDLPGTASNVQNGLGLVTGIVSKTQPWKPNVPDQQQFLFCPPDYADQ
ncbi:DUF4249 family protein [Gracilimonas tropica]|uniref:DUF4249 family protein n=1 Tax=Gracilimonas tropica TaxID=454600 RepID=UPI00036B5F46|nr:DUF4249 family protein [Gracilimonas tropica]